MPTSSPVAEFTLLGTVDLVLRVAPDVTGAYEQLQPLSSVTIIPERTVGDGRVACVYGQAGWVTETAGAGRHTS